MALKVLKDIPLPNQAGLQLKLEKRLAHGLSHPQDKQLSRELAACDVPRRLTFSGVCEFPIGPGKNGCAMASFPTESAAGASTGPPSHSPASRLRIPAAITSWAIQNFRGGAPAGHATPLETAQFDIRTDSKPQYDATLICNFRIREGHRMQLKVSPFNVTNTAIFGPPNTTPSSSLFGVVPVTQINLPRDVELGFRYSF